MKWLKRGALGVLAFLGLTPAHAMIEARIFNGSGNNDYHVYYDTDWVAVGTPVNVHIIANTYNGGIFESGGTYYRWWEGGDANFTVNPPPIWDYQLQGMTNFDYWMSFVPNEAGDFRMGVRVSTWPGPIEAHAYVDFHAYVPKPGINSSLFVSANEGQTIDYTITATGNPTSFSASNLPAGLSFDSTTGRIWGRIVTRGTIASTIGAANSVDSDSKTLTWTIESARVISYPSVSSLTVYIGDSMTLYRDGYTNFPLAWVQSDVSKPVGAPDIFPNQGYGSMSYTPNAGLGEYIFTVRVVDMYYNFTYDGADATRRIVFNVVERPPPPVPTGLTATANSSSTVSLSWNASDGAAGYTVYRGGTQIATTTSPSYNDSGLATNTTYSYSVSAYNSRNISSSQCTAVNVATAPAAPTGLTGTPNPSGSISLSWSATAGAAGYAIYRNGTQYTTSASASFVDSSTSVNTSFSYAVVAYNSANTRSASSSTISVLTAPGVPTSLSGAATGPTSSALSWAASAGAVSYVVYRNGASVGTPTATNFSEGGLAFTTTYNYSVAAKNSQGTVSSPCTAIAVTTMQNPPPPTPLNFTGSAVNSTRIALSWSASPGAAGYAIYKNGTQINTTTTTNYTDQGLTGQTSYQYSVASYNPQGAQSARTSILTITTPLPDPLGDDDGDGILNGVEQALGTDVGSPNTVTSNNANVQLNVNPPK